MAPAGQGALGKWRKLDRKSSLYFFQCLAHRFESGDFCLWYLVSSLPDTFLLPAIHTPFPSFLEHPGAPGHQWAQRIVNSSNLSFKNTLSHLPCLKLPPDHSKNAGADGLTCQPSPRTDSTPGCRATHVGRGKTWDRRTLPGLLSHTRLGWPPPLLGK